MAAVAKRPGAASNGAGRYKPDLVITDIKMPDMDGIEAAEEICRDARSRHPGLGLSRPATRSSERKPTSHGLPRQADQAGRPGAGHCHCDAPIQQMQSLRKEAADLRQALADRKIIERAKGILMNALKLNEKDAFRRLQELASEKNLKLVQAAETITALERAAAGQRMKVL